MKIISSVKKYMRRLLPKDLYVFLYTLQFRIKNKKDLSEKQKKFAQFKRKGFYDFELDDKKFKIFLDPDNGGVDYEIFAEKNFEPGVLSIIRDYLEKDKNSVFVDIGANIGQHSIFAAHFCSKVYAFEPITKIYNQFKLSIEINNISNITPVNCALGDKKEKTDIYSNEINMGASSIVIKDAGRQRLQTIEVETLDGLEEGLGIDRIDFVKIDVEGFEWSVLQGAKQIYEKYLPTTLIELTPLFYNKIDSSITQHIYDFFVNLQYEIYDVGNNGEKYIRVKSFDQVKDIDQTNLLCLRS